MGKDPAFLFYTSDFILGTWVMSFEDRGKYITLLAFMHQHGRVNTLTVQAVIGEVSDMLKMKFKIDENGLWYNERLEYEIAKRKKFVDSRVNNGRMNKGPETTKQEEQKPSKEKYSFESFWNLYDKKTERLSCLLKWRNLPEPEKAIIMQRLPAYVKATPEKQYRKNPLTYLKRKAWQDELKPEAPKAFKKSAIEQLAETGNYE